MHIERNWRAQFTRREGFPAGDSAEEKRLNKPYRDRITVLLDALRGNEELRDAFAKLRRLPPPRYTDDQWSVVGSIVEVLRRAAGELRVVLAETLGNASYVIKGLFATNRTMSQIFWSAPNRTGTYKLSFSSWRTSGMTAVMDPRRPGEFYRSVVGKLSMTANDWRP